MDKIDRYKVLIRYIVSNKIAKSQKDFGEKLGYKTESSFSQIINGKVNQPKDFIERIKIFVPTLNEKWIETGEGDMLVRRINQSVNGDNNTQIAGNNSHIALPSTLDRAINEIAEQRKLVSKAQEQIDRLITLLENK